MMTCPKIESCSKVQMVLDKDLSFDWLYSEEIKKVCQLCTSGAKEDNSKNRNKKTVILTYS
jgi:hypothetical protein